ncbi:hypothetical protein GGI13_001756 [Coemansia sp. RSA 455]|nr:hypothetical protein GGI14_003563 [Coemansia sp. S680]KAJ2034113.1 hypothetical protein H4S03_005197 [Coemansia sp. S3946]KAJ2044791.1 hypothetical protein H4S04_006018 [Coemansia sp. S16]KAJ2057117.1 hypothetical protein GGI08_003702 [Coemansia sp. S2]KAJ2115370.1 hypothetical protein IW146_002356 [Coemansia sp. RSA 922]KAJ2255161.1 hypothetical protein GGI13_001756 [Coemansia sp. RSA 455]KAJ2348732.1 hypothetical protein GGH92_002737 [Coemansia sp. RSA 2673]KAJ2468901.1 hypothetical pro
MAYAATPRTRFSVRSTLPHWSIGRLAHSDSSSTENDDVEQAARNLQTDSEPTQTQLPPVLATLRQRAQSSPWVQQLISGQRLCKFSGLYLPQDMQIRVKPKRNPLTSKSMLSIDELDRFSSTLGLSQYLPLTARGLYAAVTDQTNSRAIGELGWIRPDIVEHCARVLRLRSVATMHRAHLEYVSHLEAPAMLAIPAKGSTYNVKPSRLDVIRMEVNGRILRQDAMWWGPSVFLPLPDPLSTNGQVSWQLSSVLPAAGLQCIIELPAVPPLSDKPLSVSSEACAHTVWHALMSQHTTDRTADSEEQNVDPVNILTQFATWKAYVMPGKPEPHSEPTLSMAALKMLYRCLPQLTPDRLAVSSSTEPASRSKRRRAKKVTAETAATLETEQAKYTRVPTLSHLDAVISYGYSLYRPGHPSDVVDGQTTKTVPVYNAQDIFGLAAASTVIPWLLQVPMSAPYSNTDSSSSVRYVGVVALPCTVELATQLHRVVTYASNI